MPGPLSARRVLLVEGADDVHVVRHLCRCRPDMPAFDVLDKKGYEILKAGISPEIKVSGTIAIGILVDANQNATGRWQAIAHQLRQAAVAPPERMAAEGTIVGNRPRVGIWLMPDNGSAGELEDFIGRLIPPWRSRLAKGAALHRRYPCG